MSLDMDRGMRKIYQHRLNKGFSLKLPENIQRVLSCAVTLQPHLNMGLRMMIDDDFCNMIILKPNK